MVTEIVDILKVVRAVLEKMQALFTGTHGLQSLRIVIKFKSDGGIRVVLVAPQWEFQPVKSSEEYRF